MKYPSKYDIDNLYSIFETDAYFITLLEDRNYYVYDTADRQKNYKILSETMLQNDEYIKEHTIEELVNEGYLASYIDNCFQKAEVDNIIRQYIFYMYFFYSYKNFFKNNFNYFIPSYDMEQILNDPKMFILIYSFMVKFDKIAERLDEIKNSKDIDKIKQEYLNYAAQLLGLEREDTEIMNDLYFREFLKNAIDFHKTTGTNYALDTFFAFFGYEIVIKEMWFDNRFYFSTGNQYTKINNEKDFRFYLTPYSPFETQTFPGTNLTKQYKGITGSSQIYNLYDFNVAVSEFSTTQIGQKLNLINGGSGNKYEHFKTNVVYIDIKKNKSGNMITSEIYNSIKNYIDNLCPVNIERNISIYLAQELDNERTFTMSDSNIIIS